MSYWIFLQTYNTQCKLSLSGKLPIKIKHIRAASANNYQMIWTTTRPIHDKTTKFASFFFLLSNETQISLEQWGGVVRIAESDCGS